jgi:hypothetical protein
MIDTIRQFTETNFSNEYIYDVLEKKKFVLDDAIEEIMVIKSKKDQKSKIKLENDKIKSLNQKEIKLNQLESHAILKDPSIESKHLKVDNNVTYKAIDYHWLDN